MSLEDLLKKGRLERWKKMRNRQPKVGVLGYGCLEGYTSVAPVGTVVRASEKPNSYEGFHIDRPDLSVTVEGDDAEYRIVYALRALSAVLA